jgi:transaldolase
VNLKDMGTLGEIKDTGTLGEIKDMGKLGEIKDLTTNISIAIINTQKHNNKSSIVFMEF